MKPEVLFFRRFAARWLVARPGVGPELRLGPFYFVFKRSQNGRAEKLLHFNI